MFREGLSRYNVLASALATRGLCADLFESVLTEHELLTSRELLTELERVLITKLGIPAATAEAFCRSIGETADIVATPDLLPGGISDPDDVPLLAAAIAAGADCFVTGDKALVGLGELDGMPVISPRRFWEWTRPGQ